MAGGGGDERSTVVVGSAPPLEDVISGAYTERPFDLASFSAYAVKNLFSENLDFLREVRRLWARLFVLLCYRFSLRLCTSILLLVYGTLIMSNAE